MELTKIQFEDGQKVSDAYVEIDGVRHTVTKAQYTGKTPLSARNLNKMQENMETAISDLDERVVPYRNVLVDEQALIKECGNFKLKALNKLVGKTEQEVRSGKNKFNLNSDIAMSMGSNSQVIENGLRIITKNESNNLGVMFRILDLTNFAGKTLTLFSNIKSSSTNNGMIVLRQNNYDYSGTKSNELYDDTQATTSGTYKIVYKVADTITDDNRYLFCMLYSRRNATGTSGEYVDYTKIQLEEGSTATEYEAYGKAPTPNFPSEVKTVTGNVGVNISNENLFIPEYKVDDTSITVANATLSLTDDEYTLVATGADMYFGNVRTAGFDYSAWAGRLYNVKGKSKIHFLVTNDLFTSNYITAYDSNKKSLGFKQILTNKGSYDIPENAEYISLRIGYSKATVGETYKTKVMLSFEENAEYVRHQSQVFPLTLGDIELCKIGDYADYIYRNGSKWHNYNIIGKDYGKNLTWKLVDNTSKSDTILRFTTTVTNMNGIMTSANAEKVLYSNAFECEYIINAYTKECIAPHNTNKNQINMFVDKSRLATEDVNGLLAFLEENNIYFIYPLATPTDTEITDTTLIAQLNALENANLYEGITNIIITGDNLTPIADIDYWTWFKGETGDVSDLQRQIDELRSMIENLNN